MASYKAADVNVSTNASEKTSSSNNTEPTNTELSWELLTVIQITCYSIIIVAGTIGNLMLILHLAFKRHRKTSQYFILNLATVDLLTCALSIPFDISLLVLGGWPFGPVMCRLVYPLQTLFMAVSVSTLLCMALERYRAIIHPLKPKIPGRVIILVIFLIWVISTGLVSPYAAALKMTDGECVENWPNNDPNYPKAFTLCVFLILYLSPLCVITAAYARVGVRLRVHSQKAELLVGAHSGKSRSTAKNRTRQNIRIVKFFVLVVVAFALCLLPFQVMWMWSDFGNGQKWKHFYTFLTFANVMVYANSAVNPYIFGALARRYSSCRCFHERKKKSHHFTRNKFPFYGFLGKRRSSTVNRKSVTSPLGSCTSNRSTSPINKGNERKEQLCPEKNFIKVELESTV